jgi:hypothetical protein
MDHNRRDQDRAPARDTALADTPRVMAEALDTLADLHDASTALGKALEDAGLPRRAWRSEQAALHRLSDALPDISVGGFLTRLEDFATREGPAWLRGDHHDLAEFHEEVTVLSNVANRLQGVVHRLQRAPEGARPDYLLQRALRQPRLQKPLDTIVEILGDFEALAPFIRPLTPEQWRALLQSRERGSPQPGIRPAESASGPLTHRKGGIFASSPVAEVIVTVRFVLWTVRTWLRHWVSTLRRWPRGVRWVAVAAPLLLVLLILAGIVLKLLYPSHAPLQASSASSPSSSATALAGSGSATASTTGTAASSPSPGASPAGSTIKLALTCAPSGATATLTVKNVGSLSLAWKAQAPPTLTVLPAQGTLGAGQSATAQVRAKNKKTATGTITVTASHNTLSMQQKVSCH